MLTGIWPHWKSAVTWTSGLECASCMETYTTRKFVVAPCSHVYCSQCMASLIETCLRDESIFPVKCCKQVIPTFQFIGLLSPTLRSRYELKALEFSTSADWRIYCSNKSCSAFLGSSRGETRVMACSKCRKSTCSGCKQASHPGDTCQGNAESLQVRQMARKERWQTCPGCNAIVEQHDGCNHMTCRCRTEFCYLCGVKWKKCGCPRFGGEPARPLDPGLGEVNRPIHNNDDMPVLDDHYFLGDEPLHDYDPDFDDDDDVRHPYDYDYDSPEDDVPYVNPYESEVEDPVEHGEDDEDFGSDERTQSLLDTFLPNNTDGDSESEEPYINPYNSDPIAYCPSVTAVSDDEDKDASEEEDSYNHRYDSEGEEPYINPYDSDRIAYCPSATVVPDNEDKDASDEEDSYNYRYDSEAEEPYINPYDSDRIAYCPSATLVPDDEDKDASDEEDSYDPDPIAYCPSATVVPDNKDKQEEEDSYHYPTRSHNYSDEEDSYHYPTRSYDSSDDEDAVPNFNEDYDEKPSYIDSDDSPRHYSDYSDGDDFYDSPCDDDADLDDCDDYYSDF